MSSRDIKRINHDLWNGVLPVELDFSLKQLEEIDWKKVSYNTFYKSPEFFINKFPPGFENLPGVDKMLDVMIENAKTPLEEMEERQKKWEESLNNLSIDDINEQQQN